MMNRQKLLEAAARVYAEGGFRGATTRRIAEEAGVNEITLFRLFGSKAQLISEAMQCACPMAATVLPEHPQAPERELVEWCSTQLDAMRHNRTMIRKTLADLEEHPEMAPFICGAQTPQFDRLVAYATQLVAPSTPEEEQDLRTACGMLFGALFADAMARDVVPTLHPQPEHDAAFHYVRVFLRAIGAPAPIRTSPVAGGAPAEHPAR